MNLFNRHLKVDLGSYWHAEKKKACWIYWPTESLINSLWVQPLAASFFFCPVKTKMSSLLITARFNDTDHPANPQRNICLKKKRVDIENLKM